MHSLTLIQMFSLIVSILAGIISTIAVVYLVKLHKKINYLQTMIEEMKD